MFQTFQNEQNINLNLSGHKVGRKDRSIYLLLRNYKDTGKEVNKDKIYLK